MQSAREALALVRTRVNSSRRHESTIDVHDDPSQGRAATVESRHARDLGFPGFIPNGRIPRDVAHPFCVWMARMNRWTC